MTRQTRKFLDQVYDLEDQDATSALYRDWADSYDAELTEGGYASPARCAEALARFAEDRGAPLLDIGCGTGLSGEAFAAAGFTVIDGVDISDEMLEKARAKGVYRELLKAEIGAPLPAEPGVYAHIAAVGVMSPGHAPAALIDEAMALLQPGGLFVFTLNDHALADRAYAGRVNEMVDCCTADLLMRDHGPHLPEIDLQAAVYVLRKR